MLFPIAAPFLLEDWKVVSHLTETVSVIYMQYLHHLKHATVKKPLCSGCGMVTAVCFLSVPSLCIPAMTSTVIISACSNFILPQTFSSITGVHTKRRNCAHCSEGQIMFEDGSKKLFFLSSNEVSCCLVYIVCTQNSTFSMEVSVGSNFICRTHRLVFLLNNIAQCGSETACCFASF